MSKKSLIRLIIGMAFAVLLCDNVRMSNGATKWRKRAKYWLNQHNELRIEKSRLEKKLYSRSQELAESEAINRRYEDRFNEQDATIKAQELLIQDKDRELNERDAGGPQGVAMIESLRSVVIHKCELLELAEKCLATAMSTINAQVDLLADHGVKIPKDDYAEAEAQRAQSMVS